jgi:prolyl-tRNA synthetase
LEAARQIAEELRGEGLRVEADLRDIRPGAKYFEHELRGVPLRVEVGPRDLKEGTVVIVPRDSGGKNVHKRERLKEAVREELEFLRERMLQKAKNVIADAVRAARSIGEVKAHDGVSLVGWCGDEACGKQVEAEADTHVLGTHEAGELPAGVEAPPVCIVCGKPSPKAALVARTY